jgi:TatA/E family protein of Tat protein translocase
VTGVLGALVGWELGLVVLLVVLLFGTTRLTKLGRAIGQSPRAFKRGRDEADGSGPTRG